MLASVGTAIRAPGHDCFPCTPCNTPSPPRPQAHGVVLGYSHLGMLAAARWLLKQVEVPLREAMARYPDYKLRVVGECVGECVRG